MTRSNNTGPLPVISDAADVVPDVRILIERPCPQHMRVCRQNQIVTCSRLSVRGSRRAQYCSSTSRYPTSSGSGVRVLSGGRANDSILIPPSFRTASSVHQRVSHKAREFTFLEPVRGSVAWNALPPDVLSLPGRAYCCTQSRRRSGVGYRDRG